MTEHEKAAFSDWAILELMGHRRLGGYVRDVTLAGVGILRIDVPEADGVPGFTQYYPPGAIYCLTPTTEKTARAVAFANRLAPVQRWELPQLEAPRSDDEDEDEDLDDGYDDPRY